MREAAGLTDLFKGEFERLIILVRGPKAQWLHLENFMTEKRRQSHVRNERVYSVQAKQYLKIHPEFRNKAAAFSI